MISALTVIITTVAVIAAASVRLLRQDGDVAGDVSFESGGTLAVHFDDVPARKQQGKRSHGE